MPRRGKKRKCDKIEFAPRLVFVSHIVKAPHADHEGGEETFSYVCDLSEVIGDTELEIPGWLKTGKDGEAIDEYEFQKELLDKNDWLEDIVEMTWIETVDLTDRERVRPFLPGGSTSKSEPYNEILLSEQYGDHVLQKLLQLCFKADRGITDCNEFWNIVTN